MMLSLLRLVTRLPFLRSGLRMRMARWLDGGASVSEERFELPFFGLRYPGKFSEFIDWSMYFFGAYECEELLFFKGWLRGRQCRVCLDVGANSGHHTLFFATLFQKVHAFEPYPVVMETLRHRLRVNGLDERVSAHSLGLSSEDATLYFHTPPDDNRGTGWFSTESNEGDATVVPLAVRRGDAVVAELGIEKVDFIKFDVEAHEVLALEGLRGTVARWRPVIWLEWNYPQDEGMKTRLLQCLPERYSVKMLVVNQPVWAVFNRPDGRLVEADFNQRCNLVLFSE